jgi:putative SOS response-associated peptidase YedK
MCGRFTLIISPEILSKAFSLQETPQIDPRYNIVPGQDVAVVRQIDGHNQLDLLKWGLIPSWFEDHTQAPINACAETVHDNDVFRHSIKFNRCIIPASGFYEWLPTDGRKQPYYIRVNSSLMGFAGVWERWQSEDGSEHDTCCILTTVANDIVIPIHDRMPVVLHPDDYDMWLNKNIHDPLELQRLYQPFPSDTMFAHPVPELVNNQRFDSPSCILQV